VTDRNSSSLSYSPTQCSQRAETVPKLGDDLSKRVHCIRHCTVAPEDPELAVAYGSTGRSTVVQSGASCGQDENEIVQFGRRSCMFCWLREMYLALCYHLPSCLLLLYGSCIRSSYTGQ
jgi:hypothetical protein